MVTQADLGDLVELVLHRPQPSRLQQQAVNVGHVDPGDGSFPVAGSTVYSSPLPEWPTIRVLLLGLAAMPLRLKSALRYRRPAERQRAGRPRNPGPAYWDEVQLGLQRVGEPGPVLVTVTSLMKPAFGSASW